MLFCDNPKTQAQKYKELLLKAKNTEYTKTQEKSTYALIFHKYTKRKDRKVKLFIIK